MKQTFAIGSLLMFALSIIFWIGLTAFESALLGSSFATQRVITFLLLVLPAGIGVVLGIVSLRKKEGKSGQAVTGIVLNSLFALFHLMIILFAG